MFFQQASAALVRCPPPNVWLVFFVFLVQAEHVPLEDELEALCRLHAARAELVLSGDLESFIDVASTVEAFAFREDTDDSEEEEEEAADFTPPPAMFAFSPSAGDGPGGAGEGQGRLDDGRRRRLAALENCLDAFDRLVPTFPPPSLTRGSRVSPRCFRTVPRRAVPCPTPATYPGSLVNYRRTYANWYMFFPCLGSSLRTPGCSRNMKHET